MSSRTAHQPASTAHPEASQLIDCKNCGNSFTGHYCNQCAQRADTHRINWHYIWHEIPHSVWHVDHGIVFTLKELFTRPGDTIREFLEGKRIYHYRPLALVLILGGVLTFVLHSLDIQMMRVTQQSMGMGTTVESSSARIQQFNADAGAFLEQYFNLLQLLVLPITAFCHWLFFRRKGLNYPEHLVANTFLLITPFAFLIVSMLLFKLLGGGSTTFSTVMIISSLLGLAYHVWAYVKLFKGRVKPLSAIFRVVGAYLLNYVAIITVSAIFTATYVIIMLKNEKSAAAKPAIHAPLPKK